MRRRQIILDKKYTADESKIWSKVKRSMVYVWEKKGDRRENWSFWELMENKLNFSVTQIINRLKIQINFR